MKEEILKMVISSITSNLREKSRPQDKRPNDFSLRLPDRNNKGSPFPTVMNEGLPEESALSPRSVEASKDTHECQWPGPFQE